MQRLRVGVVYGGRSSEHEISVASAAAVFAHLDPARYEALPIYMRRDGSWSLPAAPPAVSEAARVIAQHRDAAERPEREAHLLPRPGRDQLMTVTRSGGGAPVIVDCLAVDVVFPVIHGPSGEDGHLQGVLELANVPYVGAGVLASAAAMDKCVAKRLLAAASLPVTRSTTITVAAWDREPAAAVERVGKRHRYPLFVKPANLGSSIGISKVPDGSALARAIELAREYDTKILVEDAVREPRELECGVLGNEEPAASVPGEIVPAGEFYDYGAKYLDDRSRTIVPAELPQALADRIRRLAVEAFRAVDGAGMARVDFLLEGPTGRLFLNEVNTIPGFTTISMFAKMWAASGVSYEALLDRLITLALERHASKQRLRRTAAAGAPRAGE